MRAARKSLVPTWPGARRFGRNDRGNTLVYRATDVPIPEGVGPYGGKILLTQ